MTKYELKLSYDPDEEHYHASIHGESFVVTGVGCSRVASILEAAFSLEQELGRDLLDSDQERVVKKAAHADPELREKIRKAVRKAVTRKKEKD